MTIRKFFRSNQEEKHEKIQIGVYNNADSNVIISYKKFELYFNNAFDFSSFDNFDIIIYYGSTLLNDLGGYGSDKLFFDSLTHNEIMKNEQESTRRFKEIISNLKGGKIICIIYNTINGDYLLKTIIKDFFDFKYEEYDDLYPALPNSRIKCFEKFFDKYGSYNSVFLENDTINKFNNKIIVGDEKYIYSFYIQNENNGKIVFIPGFLLSKNQEYIEDYFLTLSKALFEFYKGGFYEIPTYIEKINFLKEEKIIEKKNQYENKIKELEFELNTYSKFKSILYLDGNNLVDNIEFFLNNLGINVHRDERNIEDIWIKEKDRKIVIVEIKGIAKNIKREHIRQLERHREHYYKKDDTFPALLIVNTFKEVKNIKEKNIDISPFEIEHAVRNNVLIMRTFDLLNINYLIEKKILNKNKLIKILKNNKGWLKVTENAYNVINK